MKQLHCQKKCPITLVDIAKFETRHTSDAEIANPTVQAQILALGTA